MYAACCTATSSCSSWRTSIEAVPNATADSVLCGLPGMECNSAGEVVVFQMPSSGLTCNFPVDQFQLFPSLEGIYVSDNNLTGTLAGISELKSLNRFDVYNNEMTGDLDALCSISSQLTVLSLGINSFSGTLPSCLLSSPTIYYLDLRSTELTGALPNATASSGMQQLLLSSNSFSGPLPESITSLSTLTKLVASGSGLSGSLPGAWGSNVSVVDLHDNHFSGSVPWALSDAPSLITLDLMNNSLSGLGNKWTAEPDDGATERPLIYLRLSQNSIKSAFPVRLVSTIYPNMSTVFLDQNQFSGPLPEVAAGEMAGLRNLNLTSNAFNGSIPDSWNNSGIFQLAPVSASSLNVFWLASNDLSGSIPEFLAASKHPYAVSVSLAGNAQLDMSVCSDKTQFGYIEGCESVAAAPPSSPASTAPPSSDGGSSGLSGGAIAGIVIGVLAGVALLAGGAFFIAKRKRHLAQKSDLVGKNRFEKFDEEDGVPEPAAGATPSAYADPYSVTNNPAYTNGGRATGGVEMQQQQAAQQQATPSRLAQHWGSKTYKPGSSGY